MKSVAMNDSKDIVVFEGTEDIPLARLFEMGDRLVGQPDMVKLVIDTSNGRVAAGGVMHFDEQEALRADGSLQENLWGFNYHLDEDGDDAVEFDSVINLRPGQGNPTRSILDTGVRQAILSQMRKRVTL